MALGQLLESLLAAGYEFRTFAAFMAQRPSPNRFVILRHDVDARPANALQCARLEAALGIRGTYYFRSVKKSFNREIIARLAELGHEIGYHYEELARCRGDFTRAIAMFEGHLDTFRTLYPVTTICMHGSPLSKWDNRLLWQRFNYKDYGIIGEPYFDVDFRQVAYLTDTGRSWNNGRVSVRDKVETGFPGSFRSTFEIVAASKAKRLPGRMMINIHPQRWHDNYARWVRELVVQNQKNIIKSWIVKARMRS